MQKIRVLIAEDEVVLRENFTEILTTDEICVVATSGTAAGIIQIAQTTDFDVVLLDIDMETTHAGIIAACEILAIKPTTKVIFLTVNEDDETVFKAMETGAVDYIIKSDDSSKIISHVKKAFENASEIEYRVQHKMQREFLRLRKSESNLMYYIKNIAVLTPVEKSLIKLLLENKTPREIAETRIVELTTVKTQISKILKKFGLRRTKEIVGQIRSMGIEELFYRIY